MRLEKSISFGKLYVKSQEVQKKANLRILYTVVKASNKRELKRPVDELQLKRVPRSNEKN